MDKILKAADDIAKVFNVTQEWLEPGRSEVVKILKQLVEEKFTSTNTARDEIPSSCNECRPAIEKNCVLRVDCPHDQEDTSPVA